MKKKHLNKEQAHKDEPDNLQERIETQDFIIDALDKINTQNILSIKLLTQILMFMNTLERILIDDNIVSTAINRAINVFKLELVDGMSQIEYDGEECGYNIVPRCDDNNDDNDE